MTTLSRASLGGAGLLVGVALFVALNALGGTALRGARLDLTEGGLYTLHEGTRSILAGIEEPITLELYYSREQAAEVPQIVAFAQRVEELLQEYALAADGMLVLDVIDPAPFSEEEDTAVGAGIQGLPLPSGDLFYFGLIATSATDDTAVIPFLDPSNERFLEYDLSRFLYRLGHGERPRVGVLSSLPVEGAPSMGFPGAPPASAPWYLLETMGDAFEVSVLGDDDALAGHEALLVVHPKGLDDDRLYELDQFVLAGGRALVLVDPRCEEDQPPADPNNPLAARMADRSSDLAPLLEAWGVAYDRQTVLGDEAQAAEVTAGDPRRPERVAYLPWIEFGGDSIDQQDPITAGLGALLMPGVGALAPTSDATTEFVPLITTSDRAGPLDAMSLAFSEPSQLRQSFQPTGQRYTVAARVSGPVASAFPDGPPGGDAGGPDAEGADADVPDAGAEGGADASAPAGHRAASDGPIHVIVVADADLGADRWWVRFQNLFGARLPMVTTSNADFLVNALDSLAGSADLIGLRGRGRFERPFETIEALRVDAEQRYLAEAQRLEQELDETNRRLRELRSQGDGATSLTLLSPEELDEIARFQQAEIDTRKKLRGVRYELNKDVDGLKDTLMFANTLGLPLIVLLGALVSWFSRRGRASS